MWFLFLGVYLSLWSGSKYIASLLQKLKSISGAENEGSLIRERLYAVLYATIFLVLSIVSIMFSVAGHQFFNYIMEKLSARRLISGYVADAEIYHNRCSCVLWPPSAY